MRRKSLALLCLLLLGAASVEREFTGTVTAVIDGDTLTVLVDQQQVKVRLAGIDAPERKQDYGTVAKSFLSDRVFGRYVSVEVTGQDRYGRTLGVVHVDGANVNLSLVRAGLAWHYVRFSDDTELAAAEREAREARRGLWERDDAVPPWEWRRQNRAKQTHPPPSRGAQDQTPANGPLPSAGAAPHGSAEIRSA